MGDPDLIMIDEPTEGLAPKIVELVAEYLKER
jgi:branched-chain amino acid transport system ATP-binding protein